MPLITTIVMLRQYCAGLTVSATQTASLPDMTAADETYIIPVLGRNLYTELTPGDLSANPSLQDLRELCRRVVAPLALRDTLPLKQVQVSDIGIHNVTLETLTPAPRWAFLKLEEMLSDRGAAAIESLWVFLYQNADALGWVSPVEKTLFAGGSDFAAHYWIKRPHTVYISLLPIIREVEEQVYNKLGDTFVKSLRDKQNLSTEEAYVLKLLKRALANLTINVACSKLATQVTGSGFTVLSGDAGDRPEKGEGDSSWTLKQALMAKTESDGTAFLNTAFDYLNTNASRDLFPLFFESPFYTAPPTVAPVDPNSKRNSLFAL